jgi:hypothetical protein
MMRKMFSLLGFIGSDSKGEGEMVAELKEKM